MKKIKSYPQYKKKYLSFVSVGLSITLLLLFLQYEKIIPTPKPKLYCRAVVPPGELLGVFWTPFFGLNLNYSIDVEECPYKCHFINNRDCFDNASALIFTARDTRFEGIENIPTKRPYQKWILWSVEPPIFDQSLHTDEVMSKFDYWVSHRLDAPFSLPPLVSLFPRKEYGTLQYLKTPVLPLNDKFREKKASVLWVASNCKSSTSKRERYIQELMKYIPIHSAGDCLNNHEMPTEYDSFEGLYKYVRKYKFYLAMENSNCQDYVTEKLYRTMDAGVVPIVDGPIDYTPFIPNNKSVIRVDNFASPKELAEYLIKLDNNDELYMEYLAYRYDNSTWTPEFKNFLKRFHDPMEEMCKLCKQLHEDKRAFDSYNRGDFSNLPVTRITVVPDRSCVEDKWVKYPMVNFSWIKQ